MRARSSQAVRPDLGTSLRAARQAAGISLETVALSAGISKSHLSRLERGERDGVSRQLLERLAEGLKVDSARLFTAAGILAPGVERDLADNDLCRALEGERLPVASWEALRRLHIAQLAFDELQAARADRIPISAEAILRRRCAELREVPAAEQPVDFRAGGIVVINTSGPQERVRFWMAHAAGHVCLEESPFCTPGFSQEESDATAFASFVLAPRLQLANTVRELAASFDAWAAAGATIVSEVAERFGVPLWLAARRIGEERLLAEAAGVSET